MKGVRSTRYLAHNVTFDLRATHTHTRTHTHTQRERELWSQELCPELEQTQLVLLGQDMGAKIAAFPTGTSRVPAPYSHVVMHLWKRSQRKRAASIPVLQDKEDGRPWWSPLWFSTWGPQMFLDYSSQKSWPAQLVVKAPGSCRISGDPWVRTTALQFLILRKSELEGML